MTALQLTAQTKTILSRNFATSRLLSTPPEQFNAVTVNNLTQTNYIVSM